MKLRLKRSQNLMHIEITQPQQFKCWVPYVAKEAVSTISFYNCFWTIMQHIFCNQITLSFQDTRWRSWYFESLAEDVFHAMCIFCFIGVIVFRVCYSYWSCLSLFILSLLAFAVLECPSLLVDRGNINTTAHAYSIVVGIHCQEGYSTAHGPQVSTLCLANQTWLPHVTGCQGIFADFCILIWFIY